MTFVILVRILTSRLTSRCKKPIWGHGIGQSMDIAKKLQAKANLRARSSGYKVWGMFGFFLHGEVKRELHPFMGC